eukprot:sb/3477703/
MREVGTSYPISTHAHKIAAGGKKGRIKTVVQRAWGTRGEGVFHNLLFNRRGGGRRHTIYIWWCNDTIYILLVLYAHNNNIIDHKCIVTVMIVGEGRDSTIILLPWY